MDVVGERSLLFFPSANEESPLLQSYRFVYEMRDLRECSLKKNIVDVERDAVSFSEGLSRVISIPVQKKHYGNIVFRESLARLYSILCDGASKTFVEVKKLARKGLSTLHHEQCPKKQVIAECPCLFASRILSSKLFFFFIKAGIVAKIPPRGRLLFHVFAYVSYFFQVFDYFFPFFCAAFLDVVPFLLGKTSVIL